MPAAEMQPSDRGGRLTFSISDDGVMLKQIQAVHAPDGRVIDVRPLLHIVEDIFSCATPSADAVVSPVTIPKRLYLLFYCRLVSYS